MGTCLHRLSLENLNREEIADGSFGFFSEMSFKAMVIVACNNLEIRDNNNTDSHSRYTDKFDHFKQVL